MKMNRIFFLELVNLVQFSDDCWQEIQDKIMNIAKHIEQKEIQEIFIFLADDLGCKKFKIDWLNNLIETRMLGT